MGGRTDADIDAWGEAKRAELGMTEEEFEAWVFSQVRKPTDRELAHAAGVAEHLKRLGFLKDDE